MSKRDLLFQTVFGSSKNDGKLLLEAGDQLLSKFVYNVACEESFSYTTLNKTSDEKVQSAMKKVDRVIDLFENAVRAKKLFLNSFEDCSPLLKVLIKQLRGISKFVENTKICSKVVSIISGIVGTLAGGALLLSSLLFPPAAVVAAIGIGWALKDQEARKQFSFSIELFKKAKLLIKEELDAFLAMSYFFSYLEKLERSITVLIDYDVLEEMSHDAVTFFSKTKYHTNIKVGEYKDELKEMLNCFLKKMKKNGSLEFGNKVTPVAITFFFVVCLMKDQNRIVWLCIMELHKLKMFPIIHQRSPINQSIKEMLDQIAKSFQNSNLEISFQKIFELSFVNAKDFLAMEPTFEYYSNSPFDIRDKIHTVLGEFFNRFKDIEKIYTLFNQYESIANTEESPLTTIIVQYVPVDATEEDIKTAIKPHLSKEAWDCIKLEKLSTRGNHWLIRVSPLHSKQLFHQRSLVIKNQNCVVYQ